MEVKHIILVFLQMKKMGLEPEDPTYSALFNACANSPFPENGLKSAILLREKMKEKSHQPNRTTYKVNMFC
jgi:pentatricopeptide repeat domain-containing protein 1